MYIREEDAAASVFDVLKLSKVSGVSGCVGKTVRPFVKLCAKTKSVSSVGKVSSINKLVSDIRKYLLQYINIKKYKHYTNVPATSYQLIQGVPQNSFHFCFCYFSVQEAPSEKVLDIFKLPFLPAV